MAKILHEKEISSFNKNKPNKIASLKPKRSIFSYFSKILPWFYLSLGFLFVFLTSFYVYKNYISKKDLGINLQETANVCEVSFNIGHTEVAPTPGVSCSKFIEGFEENATPEINVGDTLKYVLKITNPSDSDQEFTVKSFLDKFEKDYSDYLQILNVTSSSRKLNCIVTGAGDLQSGSDDLYGTVICTGNPSLKPGDNLIVNVEAKVIKESVDLIKNEFTSSIEDSSGNTNDLVCSAQFKTVSPPEEEKPAIACESSFSFEDGSPVNRPVKPGDILKITISSLNTGNVSLHGVEVINPLDDSLSSEGAKNLNWLEFKEFTSDVPLEIINNCTVRPNLSGLECAGINLNYQATIDIPFLVKVKSNIEPNQQITNVSRVKWNDLVTYCKDSVTTAPVNKVCNQNNACEVVYRDLEDNELSCDTDADCTPSENPTHLVCQNEACVEVEGSGSNECSNDNDCKEEVSTPKQPSPKAPPKEEEIAYSIPETAGTPWKKVYLFLFAGFVSILIAFRLKKSIKSL